MERIIISATPRAETGKSAAKHLRDAGKVPAVLYGRGREPQTLTLEGKEIVATLGGVYTTHIFDLKITDQGATAPVSVMIKEVQRNPITGRLQNIDFHAISLTEKVHAQVPVRLKGEPAGAKKGGIVERLHTEIAVSCLPTAIPDHIEVDISALDIGDAIHVRDLGLPAEVEVLTPAEEIVVMLTPPSKAVEEVPVAVVAEEAAEPEVLAQKGEKEAEEEK